MVNRNGTSAHYLACLIALGTGCALDTGGDGDVATGEGDTVPKDFTVETTCAANVPSRSKMW
jgi:hypothetical protein